MLGFEIRVSKWALFRILEVFFPEKKDLGGFSLDKELHGSPYMVVGFIVVCLGLGWDSFAGERQGSAHGGMIILILLRHVGSGEDIQPLTTSCIGHDFQGLFMLTLELSSECDLDALKLA